MVFQSVFPYTQEIIAEYSLMDDSAINNSIINSENAFIQWKQYSFQQRAKIFTTIAAILKRDKSDLATLITNEMGKTISEAKAEIEKSAYVCEYYAQHAETFLKDELHEAGYQKSLV